MATSGTYAFNPSLGEIVLYAYNLCQVRSPAIEQAHMETARMATNMLLADWSQQGVNLWKVDLVVEPLLEGVPTYAVDPKTVMVLDAYIRTEMPLTTPTDRTILPVSRSEYASYPTKARWGIPTVYWFDRLISPTITLWMTPDGINGTSLHYYRVTQIQDAVLPGSLQVDIPYRWFKAFTDGLALELARTWAPSLIPGLAPFAEKSYNIAAGNDVENAHFYISPMLGGYYRN